ncbi:MAG TPA: cytochrome c oxidase subunit II [Acidimicrobiales bacterium]|nr:cytochrome c oxidase subunit II [Acidimicrobiales bacterium]
MHHATALLATNWGSPAGQTSQDHWNRLLWQWSAYFAVPIGVLVIGLIAWALIRYRHRPDHDRIPAQFQYHIPLEAAYTIIPLAVVAVIFGLMFNAENKQGTVSKQPAVRITVEGFQWGWRFVYPNQHVQVGTANYNDINTNEDLPTLVIPAGETVQLQVISLDVVHTFYVKEFLFNRDLIPGINNVFDINVNNPGLYQGQCNNICGEYHAYMRFLVDVKSQKDYQTWYDNQPACSTTTAGQGDTPVTLPSGASCPNQIPGTNSSSS